MRYYVVADVHGFYSELRQALTKAGYFKEKQAHKLIICGDLFDRGSEACQLQSFVMDLMARDEVILIRGNHEDLTLNLLDNWHSGSYCYSHHKSNGTVDTVLQLSGCTKADLFDRPEFVYEQMKYTPFITKIIPAMLDYYETEKYIFTHGWIPCQSFRVNTYANRYEPMDNWRSAESEDWSFARWINGMEAARDGVTEKGKEIVCGHWHCSYGHSLIEGKCSEFGDDADFTPYYGEGIIALDACTVRSGFVNCLVIEE